jgi:hypothetical protein
VSGVRSQASVSQAIRDVSIDDCFWNVEFGRYGEDNFDGYDGSYQRGTDVCGVNPVVVVGLSSIRNLIFEIIRISHLEIRNSASVPVRARSRAML